MIFQLAWRNIWRNRTRSLVVVVAILLGIWAAMFMSGFASGMARSYIQNAIESKVAHIQVHHPKFVEEGSTIHYLPQPEALLAFAKSQAAVEGATLRTIVTGMIGSSRSNRGTEVWGISSEDESAVSTFDDDIVAGNFFTDERKNQIVLGQKLADNLQVKLRSKVVLTFQDLEGIITAGAFRVVGIYESGNAEVDESLVLVQQTDLLGLLTPTQEEGGQDTFPSTISHELAVLLDGPRQIDTIGQILQNAFPDLLVENYRELAPDLRLYETQIQNISLIYLIIILLALVFGIINTMLMAVLERIRELGMLMAVGMNKMRVFSMIVFETLLLTLLGVPVGVFLGYLTVSYFGRVGIDLSAFSAAMQEYGLSEMLHLELDPIVYTQIIIGVTITAILASLYPAWKAIRLRPVEAIRTL